MLTERVGGVGKDLRRSTRVMGSRLRGNDVSTAVVLAQAGTHAELAYA